MNVEKLIFVCSGNIIRSAFCQIYAQHIGIQNVDSVATTYKNKIIHPKTREYLLHLGVDKHLIEKFQPKHIDDLKDTSDAVFIVMTNSHRKQLIDKGFPKNKITKITQFIGKNEDVPDPYFTRRFKKTFELLKTCVEALYRNKEQVNETIQNHKNKNDK